MYIYATYSQASGRIHRRSHPAAAGHSLRRRRRSHPSAVVDHNRRRHRSRLPFLPSCPYRPSCRPSYRLDRLHRGLRVVRPAVDSILGLDCCSVAFAYLKRKRTDTRKVTRKLRMLTFLHLLLFLRPLLLLLTAALASFATDTLHVNGVLLTFGLAPGTAAAVQVGAATAAA